MFPVVPYFFRDEPLPIGTSPKWYAIAVFSNLARHLDSLKFPHDEIRPKDEVSFLVNNDLCLN